MGGKAVGESNGEQISAKLRQAWPRRHHPSTGAMWYIKVYFGCLVDINIYIYFICTPAPTYRVGKNSHTSKQPIATTEMARAECELSAKFIVNARAYRNFALCFIGRGQLHRLLKLVVQYCSNKKQQRLCRCACMFGAEKKSMPYFEV